MHRVGQNPGVVMNVVHCSAANRSWRLRRQEAEDSALVKDLQDFSRRLQNSKAHREFNQEPEMLETKTSGGWRECCEIEKLALKLGDERDILRVIGLMEPASPRSEIWCLEDRAHFFHGDMPYKRLVMAVARDGVDLSCLCQGGRHPELDIPDEGCDSGESSVACGRAVAAFFLDVSQELENQRSVDLFEADL
jgi:hypothetical protein